MPHNMLFDDMQLEPAAVIDQAVDAAKGGPVFGMMSGGHDSLCATYLASCHRNFAGVVHINTGIGIEETREFVRQTCKEFGWPLLEYRPPKSYEDLVIEFGFPGPAHHYKMFNRLKDRCLDMHFKTFTGKAVLVAGCRTNESRRRMHNARQYVQVEKRRSRRVWANPILDFTVRDKSQFIKRHNLPRNPVASELGMSGECLCGAFASPGERELLEQKYPEVAGEIARIEASAKAAGQPHCKWGVRPTAKPVASDERQMMLCTSCEDRFCGKYDQSSERPTEGP